MALRTTDISLPKKALARTLLPLVLSLLVAATTPLETEAGRLARENVEAGPGSEDTEYRVKAVFLYKIAHWITWPKGNEPKKEIVIAVVGKDPFGKNLDLIEKLKPIRKCKVKVKRFTDVSRIGDCQIIFLSAKLSHADEKRALDKAKSKGIVTVSEGSGFADRGGMINLLIIKNKVGFEANPGAAKRAKIAISSQLLKLAHRIVRS